MEHDVPAGRRDAHRPPFPDQDPTMEWEFIAPMIMTIVLVLTVGGVMVLRPIAKRVGDLIELYVRERNDGLQGDVHHTRDLM